MNILVCQENKEEETTSFYYVGCVIIYFCSDKLFLRKQIRLIEYEYYLLATKAQSLRNCAFWILHACAGPLKKFTCIAQG